MRRELRAGPPRRRGLPLHRWTPPWRPSVEGPGAAQGEIEAQLEPDVISYIAGIGAYFPEGEQLRRDQALLNDMWEAKQQTNGGRWQRALAPISAGISACEKGGGLLSEMWETKLGPNVISYNAGVGARKKGEWQWATALQGAQRHYSQRWAQRVR